MHTSISHIDICICCPPWTWSSCCDHTYKLSDQSNQSVIWLFSTAGRRTSGFTACLAMASPMRRRMSSSMLGHNADCSSGRKSKLSVEFSGTGAGVGAATAVAAAEGGLV